MSVRIGIFLASCLASPTVFRKPATINNSASAPSRSSDDPGRDPFQYETFISHEDFPKYFTEKKVLTRRQPPRLRFRVYPQDVGMNRFMPGTFFEN